MAPLSLPPGFRFHPTDEELIICYLKRKINSRTIDLEIIPEVDLYKCEPWELPSKSLLPSKDLEWYFFSPRDRKYPNGSRTNRATKMGYWKATGKDRRVNSSTKAAIGTKKTLVYYRGRAPHGMRTGWIMHEYRLDQSECEPAATSLQDAYALCRVFKKETITSNSASSSKTQYNFPNTSHKPSSERSIYSEGRSSRYHDFGTLAYSIPVQRCSPSNISPQMAPRSSYNQQGPTDKQWMQCFADEDDFRFATPSFQNYGSTSYHPSKVEIPLGCARMQHQFTMPPLEVDASSQFDHPSNFTMPPSCFFNGRSNNDLLEDILSGHQTSEAFTNQNDMNSNYMLSPAESSLFTNTTNPWENLSSRSIEIGGKNQITSDMMVAYSNHSALPEENLEKIFARDYDDLIPVENFSDFHNQNEAQGEGGDHMINNSSKTNTFPPEFGSHDNPNRRFVDDAGDLEKFFDDFEEVEVSHSLLCVSTKGLTETYFHRVEPSRTVRVHQHKRQEMQQGVELITSEKESPSHHKTKYWKGFNTLISRFMGLPNTRSAEEETGSGLIRKMKARKGKKGVAWLVRESEGLMANFVAKTMWTPVTVVLALFSIWANVGP